MVRMASLSERVCGVSSTLAVFSFPLFPAPVRPPIHIQGIPRSLRCTRCNQRVATIFTTISNLRATSHGNDIWRKLKSDRPTAHSKLRIALDQVRARGRTFLACTVRMCPCIVLFLFDPHACGPITPMAPCCRAPQHGFAPVQHPVLVCDCHDMHVRIW